MEAVGNGTSIKRAALDHGVPRSTLQDRYSGRVTYGINPGPQPYLDKAEEEELARFVVATAKVGFQKTRKQIKDIAEAVARD